MNNHEHSGADAADAADAQVERLLVNFFSAELPEEFHGRVTVSRAPATPGRPSRPLPAGACVAAAAAVLVLGWAGLQYESGGRTLPVLASAQPAGPKPSATSPPSVSESTPVLESTVVERYETSSGPVEQRTEIRWSNVSVIEPETGSELEMLLPELSIEVFEIGEPRGRDEARK